MASRYYSTHNALRGIAAIAVTLYHLQLEPAYQLPLGWASPLLRRGYLWVDLFFILSGFVLSATYLARLSGGAPAEIHAFLRARLARIFPLHLFVLAVLALLVFVTHPSTETIGHARFWSFLDDPSVSHLAVQAALVQIWDPAATQSWNIPSWSISAEMYVYFTLPVIALLCARWPRAGLWLMAGVAAAIYAYIAIRRGDFDILDPLALGRCLASFLVGVTINQLAPRAATIGDRATGTVQLAAVAAIAALLVSPLHDVWIVAAFAVLVTSTVGDRGPLGGLGRHALLQRLGHRSFSIYLLNIPVLLVADMLWPRVAPLLTDWPDLDRRIVWSGAILLALLLAAAATFRWIETPTRNRLRALGGRERPLAVRRRPA